MKSCIGFLILWAVLILAGVAVKRVAGHPEFVVFFHLPAAVFLVMAGLSLQKARRADYEREVERARARIAAIEGADQ